MSDSDRAHSFDPADAAERGTVRVAEQIVDDAWIGRLLVADSEAATIVEACVRVRDRLAGQLRGEIQRGDREAIARARRRWEVTVRTCRVAAERRSRAGVQLACELEEWASATQRRIREAEADRRAARPER